MNFRIGWMLPMGVGAMVMLAGCGGDGGHAAHLADKVTRAVIANDMRPVEPEFNAIVRPELENRQAVGRLSDQLNALGAFRGVKETTPFGTLPGKHVFDARFVKATWVEDMAIDRDGKIASFRIHPVIREPR